MSDDRDIRDYDFWERLKNIFESYGYIEKYNITFDTSVYGHLKKMNIKDPEINIEIYKNQMESIYTFNDGTGLFLKNGSVHFSDKSVSITIKSVFDKPCESQEE